ncbi:maleylpyruvate isomerase N-terminal domain-containing protein [Glycomyces sp. TRM65418]|uniref:maleylpyruvate isomerase N-terminal domain-containing protein n=1 Tax=Glycomyces sp. TRM65418 TaxID=2867006 RepID=UPI001CE60DC3|nr:maleylpyruvate isomerase N-terminal domain-containing protein [Glycomyces sp. TRM65418]MCC3763277.1 maleylpyruvate isomerase N-terminal domain-containing protein [Glycomyces sp. TRM65418]QZD57277.1 maleylpyruvate isomerase N-terminal domain-containing protein [Glycomyces sp. TRM65418]
MIRTCYIAAARTGLDLLAHEAVGASWDRPSALEGFTVGGLAAHLAQQVTSVAAALDADHTGKERIGLYEHYARAAWVGADIDNDYNTGIRSGGERAAAAGYAAVLAEAAAALTELEAALPGRSPGLVSGNPRWPYAVTLGDFLRTRIMELVVHADDLAVSVGVDTPVFDQDSFAVAAGILARLAADRHGQAALVRALARSERAPATVSGL